MLGNLIQETANNPGTAIDVTLLGAASGRRSFGSKFASGAPCFYGLTDGLQTEIGLGSYTAGPPAKLTRSAVLDNGLGTTARLNFTGAVIVYNDLPAERVPYLDNAGLLPLGAIPPFTGNQLVSLAGAWDTSNVDPGTSEIVVFSAPVPSRTRMIQGVVRITGQVGGSVASLFPRAYLLNAAGDPAYPAVAPVARGVANGFIDCSFPISFDLNTGTVGASTAWALRFNVSRNNPVTMLEYAFRGFAVRDSA